MPHGLGSVECISVATLTLGSRPRQRACKGVTKRKEDRESKQRHCKVASQEEAWELR
jgi:hypothetical protein